MSRGTPMKPTFHHKPVNGPFEDPTVYVRILRESAGLLFDTGDLHQLSIRELLKLTDVFITHMHIDHFIGFDTILRTLLRRAVPVTFYGPEGIIGCIEGRLRGYSWNIIADYPLEIIVCEIRKREMERVSFRAPEGFVKRQGDISEFSGTILENDLLTVRAVQLDHDVPALGFRMEEKMHINIDKARLTERGYSVGPWLKKLKDHVRAGNESTMIDTGNGIMAVSELSDIYSITDGQKISYIMDSSPADENIKRIADFVKDSDTLYIEAYFSDSEIELARQRNHLTAGMSGRIASRARIKDLRLLHFSPRYREHPELLIHEALKGFRH
jgi:ribonuclease Z